LIPPFLLRRLRVFENRVPRRILGPKREDVAGGWKRLHNEELYNIYASPNIMVIKSRRMMWARHATRMGDMRNEYKILIRKPKRKRQLGKFRNACDNDIKTDLR
jgi:hypothetical protein